MIDVIDLKKNFHDLEVLKGINFKVEKGDIVAVIGPSGSGKSTFLRCLNCMEDPTSGKIIFNGKVQFGKDNFLYVKKGAVLEMGNKSSIGSRGKIICTESITFGNYARIGSESQVIDTNFHEMINTETNEVYKMTMPIVIGNYNFISNRVTLLSKTKTPNYCTIASNTLCNKDYTVLGENVLIGGIPAQLLNKNIKRNWEVENL